MAENPKLTQEEIEQIDELLAPFNPDAPIELLHPMQRRFQIDEQELRAIEELTQEKEKDSPADAAAGQDNAPIPALPEIDLTLPSGSEQDELATLTDDLEQATALAEPEDLLEESLFGDQSEVFSEHLGDTPGGILSEHPGDTPGEIFSEHPGDNPGDPIGNSGRAIDPAPTEALPERAPGTPEREASAVEAESSLPQAPDLAESSLPELSELTIPPIDEGAAETATLDTALPRYDMPLPLIKDNLSESLEVREEQEKEREEVREREVQEREEVREREVQEREEVRGKKAKGRELPEDRELSDEELGNIRAALLQYPSAIRRAVVSSIVQDKLSSRHQKRLLRLLIKRSEATEVSRFLEEQTGHPAAATSPEYTSEGVEIIYADELGDRSLAGKRRVNRFIVYAALIGAAIAVGIFGSLHLYRHFSIDETYQTGLAELIKARQATTEAERLDHKQKGERYFQQALAKAEGSYDSRYLNRYGVAYMLAGFYEEAFAKLFGKVKPDYGTLRKESSWRYPERKAPLIRLAAGASWISNRAGESAEADADGIANRIADRIGDGIADGSQKRVELVGQDNIVREVVTPGAYIIDRLRDQELRTETLGNLALFHSGRALDFANGAAGRRYKNDELGIDYYRLIQKLQSDKATAFKGIGDIYWGQKNFGKAAQQYSKVAALYPREIAGHAGLLNTFIEVWRETEDPRAVLAKHRQIEILGLEREMGIYLTSKLAAFYIDLDEDDTRIRYQIDPAENIDAPGLKEKAAHLLRLVFEKEESRNGEIISGKRYGEGFYQWGRYLIAAKRPLEALRQFQNAHNYSPRHYLAINAMGEYYRSINDLDRASQYFIKAIETQTEFQKSAGRYIEDETLLAGESGKPFYNLGLLLLLRYAGLSSDDAGISHKRLYPYRPSRIGTPTAGIAQEQILKARTYLEKAAAVGLKEQTARTHLAYWLGWIDYISGDFRSALTEWESIDIDHQNSDPNLLAGRGNALYYTGQNRSALGNYFKLQSDLEHKLASLQNSAASPGKKAAFMLRLAAAYNNIGAVYEKEYQLLANRSGAPESLRELEKSALASYWRAIETSRRAGAENEIARSNMQLAFKYRIAGSREPLLDDWVAPVLDRIKDRL